MKEIKAIIHSQHLPRVMHALHDLPHFPGITVSDVLGQGRGRGKNGEFVLTEDSLFFHKKKRLEIVCTAAHAPDIIEIIRRTTHTGTHGDGIITVTDVESVLRIRTGEVQGEAL